MRSCFIGHRDTIGIEKKSMQRIKLIHLGVTEFYSGGMGSFDKVCENEVKEIGGKITFVSYNIKQVKEKDRLWYYNIICPFREKPYSKYEPQQVACR